jgi:RhtB (resistance to homoserine/threonine) family protein
MIEITEFFMLTFIAGLMIISPGPDFAIVVKNSLVNGRSSGLLASVGVALANLCHVAVNLLGIGVLIAQSIVAFTIIKIFGALYLLYLGVKGLRAKPGAVAHTINIPSNETKRQGFYSGFLTSILNPKACLFYLSFFSVILSPETEVATQIFYGIWMSTLALAWFSLVALFFTTEVIASKLAASKHWLERITGGILMLLGLKLLKSEAAL